MNRGRIPLATLLLCPLMSPAGSACHRPFELERPANSGAAGRSDVRVETVATNPNPQHFEFQPGDLAACFGTDWQSVVIRWGTASVLAPPGLRLGPSHVAVMCHHDYGPTWVESTTLCRHVCLVRRLQCSGLQAHHPGQRIQDYIRNRGRVELYRLSPIHRLTGDESRLLSRILIEHCVRAGTRYDLAGALLSGTRIWQLTRLFPAASLHAMFCSELCAAVLMRLGRMNHDNPTRFNPARLLRTLVRNGSYRRVACWTAPSTTQPR